MVLFPKFKYINRFSYLLILFIFTLSPLASHADQVTLKGGTVLEGVITSQTEESLTIELTGSGSMTLPQELVESIVITEKPIPETIPPTSTPLEIQVIQPTPTPTDTPIAELQATADSSAEAVPTPRPAVELTDQMVQQIGQGRRLYGKTKDSVGQVEVKRPGQDWVELTTETILFEGDQIRTRDGRTKVIIQEPDHETEVRVREESEFEIPLGEETSTIDLLQGKLWSRIKSLSAAEQVKFRIRTPNAVAGVRGTLLYVEILAQDSKVAVFEGNVMVSGRRQVDRMAELSQLQAVRVSPQEVLSNLFDVDAQELREWEEWDEWARQTKADLLPYTVGTGAQALVEAQIDQIAAEGQLYSSMVAEGNREVLRNRQSDRLEKIRDAVLRYHRDLGHLPAQDRGLDYLQNNIESSVQWRGPYLDTQEFPLPVRDLWGTEITYQIRTSPQSGRVYAVLISNGPDRRFADGRGDDIMVLINPMQ